MERPFRLHQRKVRAHRPVIGDYRSPSAMPRWRCIATWYARLRRRSSLQAISCQPISMRCCNGLSGAITCALHNVKFLQPSLPRTQAPPSSRLRMVPRCPFHIYTASPCDLASFPRKRASRRRAPWGLDACFRRHDVLLASDLRNRHLASPGYRTHLQLAFLTGKIDKNQPGHYTS